jgi:hypothetical protein
MTPGRSCPLSYHYGAAALAHEAALSVDTLWVAGGLYGNLLALERLLERYADEPGSKALVFNGDFHWFDVEDFAAVDDAVHAQWVTRGNVETELAAPAAGAGCGCGYPDWVDDGTVERSNRILERLRNAARGHPPALARLAAAPMHLVAEVGGERVAVVHGDADSLAGWAFSQEVLATAQGRQEARARFDVARVRVFASSHTCLPVLARFPGGRLIANNGATGMPNFRGTRFGLATRISVRRGNPVYGGRAGALFVEAVALDYDAAAWERRFLEQWPPQSDAYLSYYRRIVGGPDYRIEQALRGTAPAVAA